MVKLVIKKIRDLKDKKKIPIIVGGTGLYFKALTNGLVSIPNTPISLRKKIRLLHKKLGQKKFFSKLAKLDPLVKDNINPSDSQRAIRAYEVIIFTNKSIFRWFKNTKSMFEQKDFLQIYIDYPRGQLIDRINSRVDKMIKMGAILEVKKFNKLKVPKNNTANKAIGVSEIKDYLNKKIQLKDVIEKISIKTRQYAKRQTTWAGKYDELEQNWTKRLEKVLKKFRYFLVSLDQSAQLQLRLHKCLNYFQVLK